MYKYSKISEKIKERLEYVIYEESTPRTPRIAVRNIKDAEKYIQILDTFAGRPTIFSKDIDEKIIEYYKYHEEMTLEDIANKLQINRKTLDARIRYLKENSSLPPGRRKIHQSFDEKELIELYCFNPELTLNDIAIKFNVTNRTINFKVKELKKSGKLPHIRRCKKNMNKINKWYKKKYNK